VFHYLLCQEKGERNSQKSVAVFHYLLCLEKGERNSQKTVAVFYYLLCQLDTYFVTSKMFPTATKVQQ
jgi:hypothetical protein